MPDKRLSLALISLTLLAACNQEQVADDSRSATGEVLEGTVSDAMLPVDRVRSEPPLEDPEAFAEAQEEADQAPGGGAAGAANGAGAEDEAAVDEAGEAAESDAAEPVADPE